MFEKDVLTLSIEGDGVRAMQTRGRQVVRFASQAVRSGCVVDGLVRDLQEVGGAIDELIAEGKFAHGRVVVAISGMRAISRIILLPKMQPSLLAGAVSREARRELPVPLEEVYLSWQALGERDGQQEVFVVGVPRELLDAAAQALAAGGLRADAMDLKPMALARAVNQPNAIVACFEDDNLEAALVQNGVPVVMRAVAPLAETHTAADRLTRLIEELTGTVRFYNDSHKDAPLASDTPLFLVGSAASPALRESVESSLTYPVATPEPPFRLPPDFPVALYTVNLGLAMKQL